jgi:endoglucanase
MPAQELGRGGMTFTMIVATLLAAAESAGGVQAIHLNQVGYAPAAEKIAIAVSDSNAPLRWELFNSYGDTVAAGKSRPFGYSKAAGEQVHQIDFSTVATRGAGFVLKVGDERSDPFLIGDGIYGRLAIDAAAFFYHQRSGEGISADLVGEAYARPAGHDPDVATCPARDHRGNDWGGCPYRVTATGGWYDAGDHGKYVVNGGIAIWTLVNIAERSVVALGDGALRIPESANGVPDILDEAREELDFLMAMQAPEGTRLRLPIGERSSGQDLALTETDVGGMAHHKLHDAAWTSLPMSPADDDQPRIVAYPSTAATLNLAAAAAQAARVFAPYDADYAQLLTTSARRAYAAAKRVPSVRAYDVTEGGGGGYGDSEFSDEFSWAATELFLTTGDAAYEADLRASAQFLASPGFGAGDISWNAVAPLATISLAISAKSPPELRNAAIASISKAADRFVEERRSEGYAIPFDRHYGWGSNGDLANRGVILGTAFDATGDRRYRDGAQSISDYLLGRNPLGVSYISGWGARPMRRPHHRFWAQGLDPAYPPPPTGALSGGPNQGPPADDVARAIIGTCAPQKCWRDDVNAYSLNEVAINWNAPLVWLAVFLDATERDLTNKAE